MSERWEEKKEGRKTEGGEKIDRSIKEEGIL